MSGQHSTEWQELDRFLHPSFVALIGRINRSRPDTSIIEREATRWGADGFAFVNPADGTIGGHQIYKRIEELDEATALQPSHPTDFYQRLTWSLGRTNADRQYVRRYERGDQ
jgi:hypothetical protein